MKILFLLFFVVSSMLLGCSKDKCNDIKCLNSGTCVDGSCACANGYTGDRCQNPPNSSVKTMKITNVVITGYPILKSDGSAWDVVESAYPDIYVKIYSGTSVAFQSGKKDNVTKDMLPNQYDVTNDFQTANLNDKILVQIWDSDNINDELMGSVGFYPTTYNTEKPSKITIQDGETSFTVSLVWN